MALPPPPVYPQPWQVGPQAGPALVDMSGMQQMQNMTAQAQGFNGDLGLSGSENDSLKELQGLLSAELLASMRHTLQVGVSMALQRLNPEAHMVSGLHSLHKVNCSCHVGFYSNEQTIGNLLHLIVQLALFSSTNTAKNHAATNPPSYDEKQELGWIAEAREGPEAATAPCYRPLGFAEVADAEAQASVPKHPPKKKPDRPNADHSPGRYGVRIGGGYHIVQTQNTDEDDEETYERARSESPVADERLKEYSQDYNMHRATPRTVHREHPYAHGAPSDATPASRFVIGAYSNVMEMAHHDRGPKRSGSPGRISGGGNPVNLYRVLRPAQGHEHDHATDVPYHGPYEEFIEAADKSPPVPDPLVQHEQASGQAAQKDSDPAQQPYAVPQFGGVATAEPPQSLPKDQYSTAPHDTSHGPHEGAEIHWQTLSRTNNDHYKAPTTPERTKTPTRGHHDRGRAPESPRVKRSRSAGPHRSGSRNADSRPVGSASKAAMSRNWDRSYVKSQQTTGV